MARCCASAPTDLDPTDPDHLTPEQCLDELCALLAAGTRRVLAQRRDISNDTPPSLPGQIPPESRQIRLDELPGLSVHGRCPVNTQEKPGKGADA
jgi:hypothetical protein